MLNKKLLTAAVAGLMAAAPMAAENIDEKDKAGDTAATGHADSETEGITFASKSGNKVLQKMQPTVKFGGYIIGKYSISDRSQQKSNGGFDLRFVRLYADGTVFKDFYYKFQLEVNDAPGTDKGPRLVDAFVEWQHFGFFKVKLGQFKRPFGFENPYSPLNVGLGSYSQITTKLASISDRCGEHKSSGRDVGLQIQGDLLPAKDGHNWLHYQLGVFNGQGINHKDADKHKDVIGGLWISPVKNLAIGGFGWNGKYTNEKYDKTAAATTKESVRRVRWGVGMKYESDWTLRGEYMSSVGGVTTNAAAPTRSDGWYATLGAPVAKNTKVYARYDCYRDAKDWKSLHTNYGISGNYYLGKNLIFQLNYTFTDDRSARRAASAKYSRYNTVDVQVTARF